MNTGVTITLDDYREIGALEEALSAHADEVLKELTDEQQQIAQTLFRRLTERVVGRGDRRRPSKLRDVAEVAGVTNAAVAAVVEKFRRADRSFLMPPPGVPLKEDTILDITHESLITLWQTLNDWVDDEARSAAAYDRLKKTAHDWPKDADVLGGINLERAVEWRKRQQPTVAWARRYGTDEEFAQTIKFLDASEKEWGLHLEREAAREKRDRENEFERVKLKAKAKVARRLQLLTVALGLVAIIAIGAAGFAVSASRRANTNLAQAEMQRREAEDQRKQAASNLVEAKKQKEEADRQTGIATEQRNLAAKNEKRAIAQAELAAKREHDARSAEAKALVEQRQAEAARAEAIDEKEKAQRLARQLRIAEIKAVTKAAEAEANADKYQRERDKAQQETMEKDQALKNVQGLVDAYSVQLNQNIENRFRAEEPQSTETVFSADGLRVFTFSRGQDAAVWNTTTGLPIKTIKANSDFLSAAFSRDGKSIVTATEKGDIVLTDLNSQNVHRLEGFVENATKVMLSGDAKRLAVLDGYTGRAKIVDIRSRKILAEVAGTWEPIVDISISEDGQQLAATARDGESKLVQVRPGQPVSIESLTTGTCRSVTLNLLDFSPRPELRARLVFHSECNQPEVRAKESPRLTPSQRDLLLGPAKSDPKTLDPDSKEAKALNKVAQDLLTREGEPDKQLSPKDVAGLPVKKSPAGTSPTVLSVPTRTERILFRLEKRQADGESLELARFSLEQENNEAQLSSLIANLKRNGLPDDVIRKISASIIDTANKLDEVKGNSEPEQKRQFELGMELYRRILADVGITPP